MDLDGCGDVNYYVRSGDFNGWTFYGKHYKLEPTGTRTHIVQKKYLKQHVHKTFMRIIIEKKKKKKRSCESAIIR